MTYLSPSAFAELADRTRRQRMLADQARRAYQRARVGVKAAHRETQASKEKAA